MIYGLFAVMTAALFYVYYDIGVNKNLHRYVMVSKEKVEKLDNLDGIIKAFSKIPLVAGFVAATGLVLNYFVGWLSILMTFTMILVLVFIWFNSVKSVVNAVEK